MPETDENQEAVADATTRKKPRRGAVAAWLLVGLGWLCLGCTAAASAASVIGTSGKWATGGFLDLFTHFRAPYAAALLLSVLAAVWLRRWRQAGMLNLALVINLYLLAPLWTDGQRQTLSPDAQPLRLVLLNVLTANPKHQQVITWLARTGADALVLQEVNGRWLSAIEQGLPGYRIAAQAPREDNFGMAVLLRDNTLAATAGPTLLSAQVIENEATGFVPQIECVLNKGGQRYKILAVHPLPPVSGQYDQTRRRQIQSIAEWHQDLLPEAGFPIVIGDLNATRWSQPFRRLIQQTRLHDSTLGFGLQGSFPAGAPAPLRIGIDHVLVDPSLLVVNRSLGPDVGSDHLPVVVDLIPATGAAQPTAEPIAAPSPLLKPALPASAI